MATELADRPRLNIRPAMGLAACAMSGVAIGHFLSQGYLLFPLLGFALAGAGVLLWQPRRASACLFIATALLFCLRTIQVQAPLSSHELSRLMDREEERIQLRARVVSDIVRLKRGDREQATFALELEEIRRVTRWQPARGTVKVRMRGSLPDLRYGDRVECRGSVSRADIEPFGLTSTRYKMFSDAHEFSRLSDGGGNPFRALSLRLRDHAARVLTHDAEGKDMQAGVLLAMLLGFREELPPELSQLFARTGTLHLFAISGLHVMILGWLVAGILRFAGVPRTRWAWGLIPVLLLFTVATGLKASAVRAFVMALLYWGAPVISRRSDGLSALGMAALIILWCVPSQLFSLGFQLSFLAVLGIILLVPVFLGPVDRWFRIPSWGVEPPGRASTLSIHLFRYAAGTFAVSLAAWLVSLPLNANRFNLFVPISLILNLFIGLFATVIVGLGCLAIFLGSIWLPAGDLVAGLIFSIIDVLVSVVRVLEGWPGAWTYVVSMPLVFVLGYYAALGLGIWTRFRSLRAWTVALTFALAFGAYAHRERREARIDVVALPDQPICLVKSQGFTALLNTGPAFYDWRVARWLRSHGVRYLDVLILSHADAEAMGAAAEIIEIHRPREVWVPDARARSPIFNALLADLDTREPTVIVRHAGEAGMWPGEVEWSVLNPASSMALTTPDQHSLVMRISRNNTAVLWCGGAGGAAEAALLATRSPAAPVLILGATTDATAGSPVFLAAVNPERILIPSETLDREGRGNARLLADITALPSCRGWSRIGRQPISIRFGSGHITLPIHPYP